MPDWGRSQAKLESGKKRVVCEDTDHGEVGSVRIQTTGKN